MPCAICRVCWPIGCVTTTAPDCLTTWTAWGYTFRLGSARAWFEQDADDARTWLLDHGIIDKDQRLTGKLRH